MCMRHKLKGEEKKRDCVCWMMGRVENGLEGDLPYSREREKEMETERDGWSSCL